MKKLYHSSLHWIAAVLLAAITLMGFTATNLMAQESLIYGISYEVDGEVATFTVDMTNAEGFDPAQHSVFVTGSMIGWTEPGTEPDKQEMVLIEDETTQLPVVTPEATGDVEYKYFSDAVAQGWGGGEWDGDPNRTATLAAGAEIGSIWGVQPGAVANLQIIHNSPDPAVSSVDIFVNDEELRTGVDFRTATEFIEVPAGTNLDVEIAPAGAGIGSAVGPFTIILDEGENYLAVASGVLDPTQFTGAAEFSLETFAGAQTEATDPAKVDVNVHHGSPDAPNVDVYLEQTGDTSPALADVGYPAFSGYVALDPNNETVGIAGAGGEVIFEFTAPFADLNAGGSAMTVLASGFFDGENAGDDNSFGLLAVLADGTTLSLDATLENGVVIVSNLAELRQGSTDGTVYRVDNEVVLTFNSTFRNRRVATDETAGIVFDDDGGVIQTEYNRNDGITGITGTLGTFNGLLQFIPTEDPGAATSTDNKVFPLKKNLADLDFTAEISPITGQLIILENVTILEGDGTATFENGTNYTVEDANGNTMTLRTDRIEESILEADEETYIGTVIPTDPVNVVGYVGQFGEIQITPRKLGDFTPADAFGEFSLTAPANESSIQVEGDQSEIITISWEAPATELQDVTYEWIATSPLALFSLPTLNLPSAATELTLPKGTVDQLLEQNGVGVGESVTLKWTVAATGDNAFRYANETWTVTIERGIVTSNEEFTDVPQDFSLEQNFPNPFNPSTQINYTLPQSANVQITVYNAVGQQVAVLVDNEQRSAGTHNLTFDASNLSSGIYLYRIQAGNFVQTRKMTLIK